MISITYCGGHRGLRQDAAEPQRDAEEEIIDTARHICGMRMTQGARMRKDAKEDCSLFFFLSLPAFPSGRRASAMLYFLWGDPRTFAAV